MRCVMYVFSNPYFPTILTSMKPNSSNTFHQRHTNCHAYTFSPGSEANPNPPHQLGSRQAPPTEEDGDSCSRCSLYSKDSTQQRPNPSMEAQSAEFPQSLHSPMDTEPPHGPTSDRPQSEQAEHGVQPMGQPQHFWYDLACGDPSAVLG